MSPAPHRVSFRTRAHAWRVWVRENSGARHGDRRSGGVRLALYAALQIQLTWWLGYVHTGTPFPYGVARGLAGSLGLTAVLVVTAVLLHRSTQALEFTTRTPGMLIFVCAILTMNLSGGPVGTGGSMLAYLLPVLFSAYYLKAVNTAIVTAASMVAFCVVMGLRLPAGQAVSNSIYAVAALACVAGLMVMVRDQHDANMARLQDMAARDPLTGLANRRGIDAALRHSLAVASETGTAVLVIDLDGFKSINDTYGHRIGDGVLQHVASVTAATLGRSATVGRTGGDEIVAVLDVPATAVQELCRQVELAVRMSRFPVPGQELSVQVSVGGAHSCERTDPVQLQGIADARMYAAKQNRRHLRPRPGGHPPGESQRRDNHDSAATEQDGTGGTPALSQYGGHCLPGRGG
ncbi:MAG: hypothetical protein CSA58_05870 [Micrococcales bacterium]|nr:MAG: hypothetical protein CSB46_04940 [Micrococcales bacterium]PIE27170.1 MAG: hypothetical protein CSA58_05870 [Micrococcales bacterium]